MELSCAALCSSQITVPAAPRTRTTFDWPIHVLLVEDSSEAAWLVQATLLAADCEQFRIEWAPTLFKAMTRLAQPGVEVVLLDLGLPELDGYRCYRAIEAAADHKIPVVILTSDDRFVSKDLTLRDGACDYLMKDRISPAELRASLLNAIRRGHPPIH